MTVRKLLLAEHDSIFKRGLAYGTNGYKPKKSSLAFFAKRQRSLQKFIHIS